MKMRRLFLYLLIASVGLSAVIGIGVILFGNFGNIEVRILFTTLTVTVTSIFGLACGAYLETRRGKYLPLTGIGLSIVSALMCFLIIWNVFDDNEVFVKSFLTTTLFAAGCSYLSLLSLARLDRRFSWTQIAAVVCTVLLCAVFLYILWFEPEGDSDLIYRILGVLGILIATITVVTPILHKLSHQGGDKDTSKIDAEIAELQAKIVELQKLKAEKPQA
ncbi:MAG: hypothetical protein ABI646_09485 [Acidobacteriota bacterium]